MFDYNVNVNDVIQLMIKPDLPEVQLSDKEELDSKMTDETKENSGSSEDRELDKVKKISLFIKVCN